MTNRIINNITGQMRRLRRKGRLYAVPDKDRLTSAATDIQQKNRAERGKSRRLARRLDAEIRLLPATAGGGVLELRKRQAPKA